MAIIQNSPPTVSGPQRATTASVSEGRIPQFDNLRALAMLAGVFLHGAFAYADPAQSLWLATDTGSSKVLDMGIWFVHLFRMSLFFLLAGYFASATVQRRGVGYLLRSRLLRILIPFVVAYPLLVVAMTVLIVFGLAYVSEPKGLLGLIHAASQQTTSANRSEWPGTMHLWFLYYLGMFTVLGSCLIQIPWPRLPRQFSNSWWIVLAVLLIPGVVLAGVPVPAPESFVPHVWPFLFYGLFYWAGWLLFGREASLAASSQSGSGYLLVCGAIFVPYYWWMPRLDEALLTTGKLDMSPTWLGVEATLTALLAVGLTRACLSLSFKYLSRPSRLLRFLADASYWVYLIHLPIVIFLQMCLVPVPIWVGFKFLAVMLGTGLFSLMTYLVFVRYTPVGWLLHGPRTFP